MKDRIFYHVYDGVGTFVRSFASEKEAKEYIAQHGAIAWNWTIKKTKRGIYV